MIDYKLYQRTGLVPWMYVTGSNFSHKKFPLKFDGPLAENDKDKKVRMLLLWVGG